MPAVKPYDEHEVGAVAQSNYEVLEKLFDLEATTVGQALRQQLFDQTNEANLRAVLKIEPWKIVVPDDVRLMVVDIENARTLTFRPASKKPGEPDIDPSEKFYVLVLPPVPRNRKTADSSRKDYKEAQAWAEAWYHATTDGHGM